MPAQRASSRAVLERRGTKTESKGGSFFCCAAILTHILQESFQQASKIGGYSWNRPVSCCKGVTMFGRALSQHARSLCASAAPTIVKVRLSLVFYRASNNRNYRPVSWSLYDFEAELEFTLSSSPSAGHLLPLPQLCRIQIFSQNLFAILHSKSYFFHVA